MTRIPMTFVMLGAVVLAAMPAIAQDNDNGGSVVLQTTSPYFDGKPGIPAGLWDITILAPTMTPRLASDEQHFSVCIPTRAPRKAVNPALPVAQAKSCRTDFQMIGSDSSYQSTCKDGEYEFRVGPAAPDLYRGIITYIPNGEGQPVVPDVEMKRVADSCKP